jgi:hypothetical protein
MPPIPRDSVQRASTRTVRSPTCSIRGAVRTGTHVPQPAVREYLPAVRAELGIEPAQLETMALAPGPEPVDAAAVAALRVLPAGSRVAATLTSRLRVQVTDCY